MTKEKRLKAYSMLSVAANSIKDDAALGKRVREILAELRAATDDEKPESIDEVRRALYADRLIRPYPKG